MQLRGLIPGLRSPVLSTPGLVVRGPGYNRSPGHTAESGVPSLHGRAGIPLTPLPSD